jgi:hypothetical protein
VKWVIKNPAPLDSRLHKWGDYHFGRSLAKYLARRGETVETHYWPAWDHEADCDVVLVLRGKRPFVSRQGQHPGAWRLLWNISHPSDVGEEECDGYDLVAVASRPRAAELDARVTAPVTPLLQCTDPEELDEGGRDGTETRRGFVFVGNTRASLRPGVLWAVEYGLPLRIWGQGWERWEKTRTRVLADYYPNERLGGLYTRSRATINDHWADMKAHGFINNRVFDALACGLPVVSDWHLELARLFPDEVSYYRDKREFDRCIERLLLNYPEVQAQAGSAASTIRHGFTFARRADDLIDLVAGLAS